jgi:hypothetical protein
VSVRRIFSVGASATSGEVPIALDGFTPSSARLGAAVSWLERHALFVGGLALIGAVILATLPLHINQDAWLALVGGRYVALHGVPHHDTIAVMTHGARWIDQQWLAQLTLYGLNRAGGMALVGLGYVALTLAAATMAIAAARRLGGREAHIIWVLPLAAFLYFTGSFEVRTQGFAYPLFVAVLWLLAAESRNRTGRRVYLVFPLLILWSNLHGSAIVGAAMTSVCGATLLVADLRAGLPLRLRRRTVLLLVGGPLCLLATPYGLAGVTYYRETLANPLFKALVTEWRPITSTAILAVPFFVSAFAAVWLLGQARGRARLFDALTLLLLIAAAISAVRNVTWFALAALVLLPSMLGAVVPPAQAAGPGAPTSPPGESRVGGGRRRSATGGDRHRVAETDLMVRTRLRRARPAKRRDPGRRAPWRAYLRQRTFRRLAVVERTAACRQSRLRLALRVAHAVAAERTGPSERAASAPIPRPGCRIRAVGARSWRSG